MKSFNLAWHQLVRGLHQILGGHGREVIGRWSWKNLVAYLRQHRALPEEVKSTSKRDKVLQKQVWQWGDINMNKSEPNEASSTEKAKVFNHSLQSHLHNFIQEQVVKYLVARSWRQVVTANIGFQFFYRCTSSRRLVDKESLGLCKTTWEKSAVQLLSSIVTVLFAAGTDANWPKCRDMRRLKLSINTQTRKRTCTFIND